jgi:hypothetical protein
VTLTPTGQTVRTSEGINCLAHDSDGARVIVSASDHAIQDYGWPTIWQAAATKYNRGEFEQNDSARIVPIRVSDCEAERNA